MKMIIDWDTVIAMSEEIDVGDSIETKKNMIDLDVLYSIGKRIVECHECIYRCAFSDHMCIKNGLHTCPEDKCCREGKTG